MPGSIAHDSTTYNWISLRGYPQKIAEGVEELTRPGVDGHAFRLFGKRGPRFKMLGIVDTDTLAAAETLYNDLKDLQGELVTVVTDRGGTFNNVMVHEVGEVRITKAVAATPKVSALAGALVRVEFILQCTE